jgi:hypothetical protein
MRLALAALVLVTAACATTVGVWDDKYPNMDSKLLRSEVEKTLHADSWVTSEKEDQLVGVKADGAGHQTSAIFAFSDDGKGSTYHMTGYSGHVVNWLTFGIIGASTKPKARTTIGAFIDRFKADHPAPK